MEAELGAAAAKAKRGGKDDSTLSGAELAVVVKFVHLKNSKKGWSSYSSKKERVAYLSTLTPAWTELVLCDVPAAVAAPTTWPGMDGGAPPPGYWPPLHAPLAPTPRSPPPAAATAAEVDYTPRSVGCAYCRYGRGRRVN